MNLLVDVGNSRIKWGTEAIGVCSPLGNEPRPPQHTEALLDRCWASLPTPDRVLVSNVAGAGVAKVIAEWVKHRWERDVTVVMPPRVGWGVTNGYTDHRRLGADRWAKLVAVRRHLDGNAFIVDFGTAVTMDVLDHSGLHHGGLILPGLQAMRKSLASSTQGVKVQDGTMAKGRYGLLARDTVGAVMGGTTYAMVATVERVAADVEAAMDSSVRRIVTGGDAPKLLPLLASDFEYVPNLVLNGLAIMATQPE